MTLYMRLGGRPAIVDAVERLSSRLSHDTSFCDAAKELPEIWREDFSEFLIFLSGGAPFYDSSPISTLLSPLCPTDEAFDVLVDHLAAVLIGRTRSVRLEAEMRLMMEHVRPYIVSDGAAGNASGATLSQASNAVA
ncbi:Clp protease ClpP [Roseibium polysiphoniae]|uniref:Clp protease ClpP n=2 Tax=Roseibium polysiphoniae TaxID=2571221 RepID=A0ABR9C6C4_9HYPH|nr:Clp protease ClpP [Roseibium polysiphoniae]MBD8875476.1 Clp protease ClpP [Roseibium polysiphoniae]